MSVVSLIINCMHKKLRRNATTSSKCSSTKINGYAQKKICKARPFQLIIKFFVQKIRR